MTRQQGVFFDWALWFLWIMATTLGWILGRFLLPNLSTMTVGLALGVLQWFLLQHRIRNAWRWILATTIGWIAGSTLILLAVPDGMDFLAGVVVGLSVGAAQWLVLRQEIQWAGWWIMINVVAWTTGMALIPGFLSTGAMVGAITGIALGLLLRYPKPRDPMPGESPA